MEYVVNKSIMDFYNEVKESNYDINSINIAIRNIRFMINSSNELKHQFDNSNYELMILYYKIFTMYGCLEADKFYYSVIVKGYFYDINSTLKYLIEVLNIKTDDIEPIGHGEMGYAFKINDNFVLKINCRTFDFNIPIFYRVNDFIYRKKFGDISLCISPLANTDDIDIFDAYCLLADFDANRILLLDNNVSNNIGIVDYEISADEKIYVEGVQYLNYQESRSFQKRKVKLINQDFIKKAD